MGDRTRQASECWAGWRVLGRFVRTDGPGQSASCLLGSLSPSQPPQSGSVSEPREAEKTSKERSAAAEEPSSTPTPKSINPRADTLPHCALGSSRLTATTGNTGTQRKREYYTTLQKGMETPPPPPPRRRRRSSSGTADSLFRHEQEHAQQQQQQRQRMSTTSSSSGADADEEKALAASAAAAAALPSAEFLLHVAEQISRGFQQSLTKVVSDIGLEYGIAAASLAQLEKGEQLALADHDNQAQPTIPADVRVIIQELQSSRQKEKELRQLVADLQSEQKLTKERLALYSVLALKLKRELINERLAHIDSKKEVTEARAKLAQLDSGEESAGGASAARSASQDNTAINADEDDPWSSPGKTPGSSATAGSNLLSFTSFYHSSRAAEGSSNDDEPPSPMSSVGGGLQPLRNSLMGQFLPSSLLDSPQITPSSRASSSSRSFGRKDDRLTFEAEIKEGLEAFSLSEPPCNQCKQNPVSECVPCGHRLCASCEASMLTRHDLTCPRCRAKVSSIKELKKSPREEDNQVDHILEGDASSSSLSSVIKQQSGSGISSPIGSSRAAANAAVSPITLSLMAELFDSIPVEQLETALKESSGQASLAIEKILHNHPSFNPGSTAPSSESPMAPGHKAALHRSASSSANQGGAGTGGGQGGSGGGGSGGGGSGGASSNWKTEMCMYYLQGKCNKTRRTCSFAHGESDLVRSNTAKHSSSAGFKSRLCPLYLEGVCPKSRRDCPLAHGESDLRDGLASLTSNASLPAAAPRLQSYKTELCYYYLKGCCNYTKDECRFAHGESDLRTVESNTMEWSAKLGGGGGGVGGSGGGSDYPSGPGSVGSVAPLPSGSPGLTLDKQLQHQHQYQQQFQPQFPQQQLPVQPPQQPPGQQQLQHGSPAFPPPPHQLALPHHQFSYQHHLQQQQQHQHMPQPPHMPLPQHAHHQQQQQVPAPGMYHGNPQAHQFRYMKSMEDAAKRAARPPSQPRRDTSSWSGYDPSSSGGDF